MTYRILADVALVIHLGIVLFVILGLLVTLAGAAWRWRWVRGFWFRLSHLAAIGVVVGQAWCGVICPLTMLENHLLQAGGREPYPRSFIAYWVGRLMYYDAPWWVVTAAYTAFGLTVLATFIFLPPRLPWRKSRPDRNTSRARGPRF